MGIWAEYLGILSSEKKLAAGTFWFWVWDLGVKNMAQNFR
jgi:hypothetical protein